MRILFMHPNIPGQYKHLCKAFADDPANQVVFLSKPRPEINIPGVVKVEYAVPREPSQYTHRYLTGTERGVLQGQEAWRVCVKLRDEEGFTPDVVCAHPGWGDALFIKDVYPNAKVLSFFEFYYRSHGSDVGFENPCTEDDKARIRIKNILNILSLENADWGVSPTHWQMVQHPVEFQSKLSVIHDGIDTDVVAPNPEALVNFKEGISFRRGSPVITYIARNFEHYRGFPTFMRAAKLIQEARKDVHIIAVGADDVSYGKKPTSGTTFRHELIKETGVDLSRLHFVGTLPYNDMLNIMRVSAAHIYLTYPFVLSWSMLEAMSCECLMVASKTPPVEEVITDGVNGLLVDFFSPEQLAEKLLYAVDHQAELEPLRNAARKTVVDRYDLKKLLPLQMSLITDLGKGLVPPPTAELIKKIGQREDAR
jgi:glycosyltransferase involved in cell wall biosynthesis